MPSASAVRSRQRRALSTSSSICCFSIINGGETRSDSVLNGVNALDGEASDWVMVHDCVRPCVRAGDINRLYNELKLSTVGGLLGLPVIETLKQVSDRRRVVKTVLRDEHWLAQTPQMFRLGLLKSALQQAKSDDWNVTDEASAIEMSGETPIIIQGSKDNIKITTTEDLAMAEYILQLQEQ